METYNERIDKILAASGLLTRSEARTAAKCGRITLDGKRISDCSVKATQQNDLRLDGNRVTYSKYLYILLNKPAGYVCSTDERDGIPVMDIFGNKFGSHRISPVGRLDKDTTGALLLTDDGVLGHMLLSPSRRVDKVYLCTCKHDIEPGYVDRFAAGIDIGEDRPTLPAELIIVDARNALLTLREGKFHQVKRMFETVGNKIVSLHRISFAGLSVDNDLGIGEWRYLTANEIEHLFAFSGKNAQ